MTSEFDRTKVGARPKVHRTKMGLPLYVDCCSVYLIIFFFFFRVSYYFYYLNYFFIFGGNDMRVYVVL